MNPPRAARVLVILAIAICGASPGCATDNAGRIKDVIGQAERGAVVFVPPGRYQISDLEVPPKVTLYAPQGATLIGNLVVRGPGTVIRGFTLEGGQIDISNSQSAIIGDCTFRGGETSIRIDGASGALIVNNTFHDVAGGVITGWGLDRSTISGNHFSGCGQCINLAFNNDRARGRDIVIERNIFKRVARMPIEVGPIGAYTENLIVRDNWAEDFSNRGPDPGETMSTFVAYSLVPTNGVNTVITGNYAVAGSRGHGDIGIELAGSGEIANNHVEDFRFGAIVYGADFHVHDNLFLNTTDAVVLNYAKQPGRIDTDGNGPKIGLPPERRRWPCGPATAAQEHARPPEWPCD